MRHILHSGRLARKNVGRSSWKTRDFTQSSYRDIYIREERLKWGFVFFYSENVKDHNHDSDFSVDNNENQGPICLPPGSSNSQGVRFNVRSCLALSASPSASITRTFVSQVKAKRSTKRKTTEVRSIWEITESRQAQRCRFARDCDRPLN